MKNFISLFLVFSILALSGNLYAKERKGADLIIQRTDGTQVRGELIAVKENSLLLLERDSGADATVDIEGIIVIKIVKKSKAGKVFLIGFAVGAGLGGGIGYAFLESQGGADIGGVLIFSLIGAAAIGLLGALISLAYSIDETIQIEGKSASKIQKILEQLRKKARVKNSQ